MMRCVLPDARSIVCCHRRLTVAWLMWAQKEAQESMELLKALPVDVVYELLLATLD